MNSKKQENKQPSVMKKETKRHTSKTTTANVPDISKPTKGNSIKQEEEKKPLQEVNLPQTNFDDIPLYSKSDVKKL